MNLTQSFGLLALVAGSVSGSASALPGPHPEHGDASVAWYSKCVEAQTAARAAGKVILIEFGRKG